MPKPDVIALTGGYRKTPLLQIGADIQVEGELVLSRPNELAVRRVDTRAGEVVVHFPRLGFQVQKVE